MILKSSLFHCLIAWINIPLPNECSPVSFLYLFPWINISLKDLEMFPVPVSDCMNQNSPKRFWKVPCSIVWLHESIFPYQWFDNVPCFISVSISMNHYSTKTKRFGNFPCLFQCLIAWINNPLPNDLVLFLSICCMDQY